MSDYNKLSQAVGNKLGVTATCNYAADMNNAWLLVERMKAAGHDWMAYDNSIEGGNECLYNFSFCGKEGGKIIYYHHECEHHPTAILLAAAKTLGVLDE